jgi:hypothetical protein
VFLQKRTLPQLFKIPLAFYGTPSFTNISTKARHLPQSWAKLIHSTRSHSVFNVRFNIIPHLCLGLQSGLFPSGFTTEAPCAFLFSPHTCHMHHTSYLTISA